MMRSGLKLAAGLVTAILALPAAYGNRERNPGVPGTLNYVEGQVFIGAQSLDPKSVGSTQLEPGQSITTRQGKTEILLTPGVFLRLGDRSSAEMISPSLTDTKVALHRGEALLEVDEIHPQNNLRVAQEGATAQLLKTGLYDFDATHRRIRVIEGKAVVRENDREVTLKGGHELALATGGKPKAEKFDKKDFEAGDLYRWSSLRSDYLAEANVDAARMYYANGWYGPGWLGAGWYWDPWFSGFTFIPAGGIFYSPFGWGFYSPLWVYQSPLFYGGYHPGAFLSPPARTGHNAGPYYNRAIHASRGSREGGGAGLSSGGGRSFERPGSGAGWHGAFAGAGLRGGLHGSAFAGHR
jgi:FecR protein